MTLQAPTSKFALPVATFLGGACFVLTSSFCGCGGQEDRTVDIEVMDTGVAAPLAAPAAPAEPNEKVPAPPQRTFDFDGPSTELMNLAAELEMSGTEIISPSSMTAFNDALYQTQLGERQTRISVFGNSLIISDRIVDVWRKRLVDAFGDGGRGFLFADRQAQYGSRSRTAKAAKGFSPFNVVWGKRGKFPHGIPGAFHVSTSKSSNAQFLFQEESSFRLFTWNHLASPAITLRGCGLTEDIVPGRRVPSGGLIIDSFTTSLGTRKDCTLHLEAKNAGAVVYGLSAENDKPGVILDNFSIIGADSTRYLRPKESVVAESLEALSPDLVVVLLGGNEIKRAAWGGSSLRRVRRDTNNFVKRLRTAVPKASCLVTGPLENVMGGRPTKKKTKPAKYPWKKRWQTDAVNKIFARVADDNDCAYFDIFAAMGGTGALKRLHGKKLLNKDMIHPRGRGLDIIGELIHRSVIDTYVSSDSPMTAPKDDEYLHP